MDREVDREVPVKIRDGPLENLWGGGGAGEVQKKILAREN